MFVEIFALYQLTPQAQANVCSQLILIALIVFVLMFLCHYLL